DKTKIVGADKFIIQLPKMVNATAGQLKIKNDLPDGMTLSNVKVYTTEGTEVNEFENTVPNGGEQVLGAFNTKYQYIVTFKGSTREGETSYYKYTLNPNIKLNHKALTTIYANSDFTAMTATDGTGAGYQDLFDRNPNTIWRTSVKKDGVWFMEFKSSRVILPTAYTLTTGANTTSYPTERPKDWKLMAKRNATDDWTTISTVSNDTRLPNKDGETVRYDLDVTGQQWQYFRLEVSATQGNSWLNLGDFELEY
ncbi:MAG: hypothetical protein IJ647_10015, partial [Prevotella sp.]|nr:hypothetical protein [Prevotella sp.]